MSVLRNPCYERMAQELALGKDAPEAARAAEALDPEGSSFKHNARKLSHHPDIRARVQEIRQHETRDAELAQINLDWLKLKLFRLCSFNLDDYLTEPNEAGERFFDIGKCSREQLERLSELTIEKPLDAPGKIRVKGYDQITALGLMARLLGAGEEPQRKDGPSIVFNLQGLPIEDQRLIAAALANEPEGQEAPAGGPEGEHHEVRSDASD
jgi:hypothetical protein